MKKGKRIALCAAGLLVLLTAALAVYLFWFTPTGYRMSVPIHGFSKVGERTYVDRGWTGDTQQLLSQIAEAQERVQGFFGEVRSAPVLFSGTTDDRRARYCLAGHEVSAFIERNGREGLLSLLDAVAAGQDFDALFFGG